MIDSTTAPTSMDMFGLTSSCEKPPKDELSDIYKETRIKYQNIISRVFGVKYTEESLELKLYILRHIVKNAYDYMDSNSEIVNESPRKIFDDYLLEHENVTEIHVKKKNPNDSMFDDVSNDSIFLTVSEFSGYLGSIRRKTPNLIAQKSIQKKDLKPSDFASYIHHKGNVNISFISNLAKKEILNTMPESYNDELKNLIRIETENIVTDDERFYLKRKLTYQHERKYVTDFLSSIIDEVEINILCELH